MISEEIKKQLEKPLPSNVVAQRDGAGGMQLDYLFGWYVRKQLNRIFGHGNWGAETVYNEEIDREDVLIRCTMCKGKGKIKDKEKEKDVMIECPKCKGTKTIPAVEISYKAKTRLTVADCLVIEGTGFGKAAFERLSDTHELALKEAETDSLKRAAVNFGNQFGLPLYDKENDGVEYVAMTEEEKNAKFTKLRDETILKYQDVNGEPDITGQSEGQKSYGNTVRRQKLNPMIAKLGGLDGIKAKLNENPDNVLLLSMAHLVLKCNASWWLDRKDVNGREIMDGIIVELGYSNDEYQAAAEALNQ